MRIRRAAALACAGAAVAHSLRRTLWTSSASGDETLPTVPSGTSLVWWLGDVGVCRDWKGKRTVIDVEGNPYSGPLPAGVASAYSSRATWDSNWDGLQETRPTTARLLILVRHGQYQLSEKPEAEARYGCLTEMGHTQAARLAARLRAMDDVCVPHIDLMVLSNVPRAKQTAKAVMRELSHLPSETLPDLAEGRPCIPEPSRSATRWDLDAVAADGARIERAFRKLFRRASETANKDECVLVVCHANVIRYFVCRALQLPPEAWLRMTLSHCSITMISISPQGRVALRSLGDVGHLEPDLITR